MIAKIAVFVLLFDLTVGHVTLTFPEARFPQLDFLDTGRTIGPCGVPKSDKSFYSTLQTGIPYNVTWRLQYSHQGGYRLYLIDYLGNLVEHLAPDKSDASEFDGLDDQSVESRTVEIHTACPNCTLVLERQALEWGSSYKFRSCAEVHIVDSGLSATEQCLDRGSGSPCQCSSGFSGDHCQYRDECLTDGDCWNGGKCLRDAIYPNRRSCFCEYGFFGKDCREKAIPIQPEDQCFKYSANAETPSNFKYSMFDEKCFKKFELNTGSDILYSRVVKDQVEIIMDYETESYVAVGWRPQQIPKTCRLFPDLSSPNSDDRLGAKTAGYLPSALDSPLHPMDCTDIIMASVVQSDYLHIEDMYTRDRSTPLADEKLDGEQSITAAFGIQRNGRTIVMFRRGIREIEPSDHPLGPGKVFVIHAKGQTQGAYRHNVPSAIEKNKVNRTHFYGNDEWRYHGNTNRGIQILEFVTAMEMRFKGPLTHLNENPDPKILERPLNEQTAFRDQVLPRPKSDAQTSTTSTTTPTPTPSPAPEPQTHSTQNTLFENSSLNRHGDVSSDAAANVAVSLFTLFLFSIHINL